MQYILSEEELNKLNNQIDNAKSENTMLIQALCIKVCNHMPIKFWGNKKAKVWGCIITATDEHPTPGFCDECPVQDVCPYPNKKWSK